MFMNFKNLQMYGLAYKRKIKELINGKRAKNISKGRS